MSEKKLGVAVVGCGRMGKRRAVATTSHPTSHLEVVSDTDFSRAEAVAKELGCRAVPDPLAAIDDPAVGAVFISTPNSTHAPLALRALRGGKHVFCEKPLSITVADAREMVREAESRKLSLMVGSNVRFFENVEKAKELVEHGAIGKPLFARGWIGHEGWVLKTEPWSQDPAIIGGGTLMDNGPHILDILRWLFGDVDQVSGQSFQRLHQLPPSIEDNFLATLVGQGGMPILFQASWTEWNGYFFLEAYGTEGRMAIDSRGDAALVTVVGKDKQTQAFDFSKAEKQSFKREAHEFLG
ncbi:MAG: Gfo/Idh/MocA family oxidoreductase, partial [Candidatus Thermoplasmatota archaeon]|nr:Gfo/Idh/MocA family oxidoreductase [Candidatus Thermoplasmatota archaeon]